MNEHNNKIEIHAMPDSEQFKSFWSLCQEEWRNAGIEEIPPPIIKRFYIPYLNKNGTGIREGRYPMAGIEDAVAWLEHKPYNTQTVSGEDNVLTEEHCQCIERAAARQDAVRVTVIRAR